MGRLLLIIGLFVGMALSAAAQEPDTVKTKNQRERLNHKQDSITSKPFVPKVKKDKVYRPDSTHSPGLAFRRSAMIPGWGQLYNHRWWKVPIIYTGLGLLGSAIVFNRTYYKKYLTIARYQREGTTVADAKSQNLKYADEYERVQGVSPQAIIDAQDSYNRNFQLSILGTLGAWGIQMIDAYIDAKFIHSYTMDNNLGLKVTPGIMGGSVYAANNIATFTPVIKITFTMK